MQIKYKVASTATSDSNILYYKLEPGLILNTIELIAEIAGT